MIENSGKNYRFLSRMGSAGVLGQALFDLANDDFFFIALTADLIRPSGYRRLIENFPERTFNIGIAEQNLIGISAGLSRDGTPVVVTSWSPFATLRCADQIKNYLGYMGLNIKIVGLESGMISSSSGASHYGLEDISLIRAISNMTIICPSDGIETYRAVYAMMKSKNSVYLRLAGGALLPMINKNEDYAFEIGKALTLKEGNDVLFISAGSVLNEVLEAAKTLGEKGISCKVLNMHTIKPIDKEAILKDLSRFKLLVTVEDHNIYGGLGSAVAEAISIEMKKPPQLLIGVNDFYPKPGDYDYLLEQCELKAAQIVNNVEQTLKI